MLRMYFKAFHFLFANREFDESFTELKAHFILLTFIMFVPVIVSYTAVAYLYIPSLWAWQVGAVCNLIHFSGVLLLRFKKIPIHFCIQGTLAGALAFQTAFAWHMGGFQSGAIIWMTILPVVAGLCLGKKYLLTWTALSASVISLFCGAALFDFPFPNDINPRGRFLADLVLFYGWLGSATGLIFAHLRASEMQAEFIQEKNEETQGLVRILCHDIATPLAVIQMHAQIAKAKEANPSLEKIERSSQRIALIIKDVRDLQAVESGKANICLESVNLKEVVESALGLYEENIRKKGLKINTENLADEMIAADRTILENQIICNLLSNAIKFSFPGGEIAISSQSSAEGTVSLVFSDKGTGIPAELTPNLFSSRKPTTTKGTAGETGTGFGMPIMKTYLERMGGRVEVLSSTGGSDHGTRFTLQFKAIQGGKAGAKEKAA
jgi:signal transduction histidine kinase